MRRLSLMPAFVALLFASVWAVATVTIATGTAIVSGDSHGGLFWSVIALLAVVATGLVRVTGEVGRRVLRSAR
jgi:hypothetical protein